MAELPNHKWTKSKTRNDRWVAHTLNEMKNGVAVECGAAHDGNMTAVLEGEYGWKCLLIEGDPRNAEKLRKNRPKAKICEAVVGQGVIDTRFLLKKKPGYSAVVGLSHDQVPVEKTIDVKTISLSSIFKSEDITDIHFLCLDMEGSEMMALNGLDFEKWQPWLVSIETPPIDEEKKKRRRFMINQGYTEVKNPYTTVDYELFFIRDDIFEELQGAEE